MSTQRLSLNCEPLNDLLGGGIELGIITNVYGEAGSGKTNFCIQAITSALKNNKKSSAVFVDTEGGFSTERFVQISGGEDLENLVLMEPTNFQEQDKSIKELIKLADKKRLSLAIVDSLVALYRIEVNGNSSKANTLLSKQLAGLAKMAREKDIPVIVTNQVYSDFDTDNIELVGRDIPRYWSKTLIKLENLGKNQRKATLTKHRSRPEGVSTKFFLTHEGLKKESSDKGPRLF